MSRRWWFLVGVIGIVVALAGVGFWLVGPRDRVPEPTASATPEEVVGAYLDALNGRDLSTVRAIAVDDRTGLVPGYVEVALRDNLVVDDVEIGTPRPESGRGSRAEPYAQVVHVPVEYRIVQSDGSMSRSERVPWGYLLVREHDDEPWQIIDQGVV